MYSLIFALQSSAVKPQLEEDESYQDDGTWDPTGDSGGFPCQYKDCGRVFRYQRGLRQHQRNKHGAVYGAAGQMCYFCTVPDCGRTFYKDFNLQKHQREIHGLPGDRQQY